MKKISKIHKFVTVHEITRYQSKMAILDNAHLKVTLCYFMLKSDLPNLGKITSVSDNAVSFFCMLFFSFNIYQFCWNLKCSVWQSYFQIRNGCLVTVCFCKQKHVFAWHFVTSFLFPSIFSMLPTDKQTTWRRNGKEVEGWSIRIANRLSVNRL